MTSKKKLEKFYNELSKSLEQDERKEINLKNKIAILEANKKYMQNAIQFLVKNLKPFWGKNPCGHCLILSENDICTLCNHNIPE